MGFTKPQLKNRRQRILVILVPCILLGLVLLVAGIGKLPGLTELGTFPGQDEFISYIFGSFWPTIAFFVTDILPWVEVILGLVLVLGIYPRIAAVLSLPLIVGFMTNNIWAISHGKTFGSCGCWGVFESLFGNTTPPQALGLDIVLLFLALTIIILHPAPFLSFQSWFAKRKGEQNT
jgi:uncharacterized membrane protein YphA (DoxX/SURF4 family)